jgi:hypothetical protein
MKQGCVGAYSSTPPYLSIGASPYDLIMERSIAAGWTQSAAIQCEVGGTAVYNSIKCSNEFMITQNAQKDCANYVTIKTTAPEDQAIPYSSAGALHTVAPDWTSFFSNLDHTLCPI